MTSPDSVGLDLKFMDESRRQGEDLLRRAAERVRAKGLPVETEVHFGSPADALRSAAHTHAAYLVVVGSHGRGALASAVLGSVAGRLVHVCDVQRSWSSRSPRREARRHHAPVGGPD